MRALICLFWALLVFQTIPAQACSCDTPRAPLEELAQARAVFSGRVTNLELADPYGNGWFMKRVTMERIDCWKGNLDAVVIVWTGVDEAMCGVNFQVDTEWLVYAFGPPEVMDAGLCSRTQPLAGAAYDLAQLGTPTCTVPVTPSTWGSMKRLYGGSR